MGPNVVNGCGFVLWFGFFVATHSQELTSCEIEKLLKPLLTPPEETSIQAQALRQRLANLLRQGLEEQADNNLGRHQYDDVPEKRNLQALARGGYLKPLPSDEDSEDENDANFKRSLQYMAQNGNVDEEEDRQRQDPKRGIASLARNGELNQPRKDLQELIEELYEKRNVGTLTRDFKFPNYGKWFLEALARGGDLGKRNIASIVRNGKRNFASLVRTNNLPHVYENYKRNIASIAREGGMMMGKRNAAALLRQDNYLNEHQHRPEEKEREEEDSEESKRNLASVKASLRSKRSVPHFRKKREADYYDLPNEEYPQPVYQNSNGVDYEELIHALAGDYPAPEKRFLGSVARSGWPSSLVKFRPDKRHIGSLARLGWLPSFRTARRFNRSGRSTSGDCGVCRETSPDGQAEDDALSEGSEKEDKRFLLIPAVDNILLRKFPHRPR